MISGEQQNEILRAPYVLGVVRKRLELEAPLNTKLLFIIEALMQSSEAFNNPDERIHPSVYAEHAYKSGCIQASLIHIRITYPEISAEAASLVAQCAVVNLNLVYLWREFHDCLLSGNQGERVWQNYRPRAFATALMHKLHVTKEEVDQEELGYSTSFGIEGSLLYNIFGIDEVCD